MIIETILSVKDGLELFKKLDIEVKSEDTIEYEPAYHNQVIEVPSKKLMAKSPTTGEWVDFKTAFTSVVNAHAKKIMFDIDSSLVNEVFNEISKTKIK